MSNPERIHINWNSSDGYEIFLQDGIDPRPSNPPTKEQIRSVLAKQEDKFFRLIGWVDEPSLDVILKIAGSTEKSLVLQNQIEPPFQGDYYIADEPLPMMTMNGDFIFDLINYEDN